MAYPTLHPFPALSQWESVDFVAKHSSGAVPDSHRTSPEQQAI